MGPPRRKASSGQGCGFLVYSSDRSPTVEEGKDNTRNGDMGVASSTRRGHCTTVFMKEVC